MKKHVDKLPAVYLWLALASLPNAAHSQTEPPLQDLEHLGDQRYRIGEIIVDREARQFSLPGRVLHLDDALEYLAVGRNGLKDYESLLELEATGNEFNLACILIGLDESQTVRPRYQFDEQEPGGQRVSITISWEADDGIREVSAGDALMIGDQLFGNESWIYLGSMNEGNQYMAQSTGTLIGFVHDPYAVIEHRTGAGIGNYGSITGNREALPDEGGSVRLTLRVVEE